MTNKNNRSNIRNRAIVSGVRAVISFWQILQETAEFLTYFEIIIDKAGRFDHFIADADGFEF